MKNLWKALLMVHRCRPSSCWLRVADVVLQSVLPLVNLYLLKMLIDEITVIVAAHGDFPLGTSDVYTFLWAMCAVFLANRVVSALNGVNNDILGQRLVDYVSDLMQRQSARLDMQYYDNPSYHDTLHRAQQEASFRPLQILNNIMALGGSIISIAGVVVMLTEASWWVIVVMIVAVVPGFAVRLYKARRIYRFRRENTQLYRRTSYYGAILTAREFAKELRTYNLANLIRGRFVEVRKKLVDRLLSISRRLGMLDVLCAAVEMVAMFAVVSLLIGQAYGGAITIGSFVMLFEAFRRGQGYLSSLVVAISGLYDNRLFIGNLFEFLELEPAIKAPAEPLPVPDDIREVEFCNVSFRYPDMDRDVLSGFSLRAERGEVVRIDGRNGFGKSTLVKLLLRLYDPQQGSILLNGIDIRRFDPAELRASMGVLFQDFARYFLSVEDNVGFGGAGEEASVDRALALSGAAAFVDALPRGRKTQLGRMFDGGAELSMGQWQRLALARALDADAPVLVLDEPTAWLDIEARQQLAETIRNLQSQKIVILITHSQSFDI